MAVALLHKSGVSRKTILRVAGILAMAALATAGLSQNTANFAVQFPASGVPAAHDKFIQGLIALYNATPGAAESFRAAQSIDPDFVMAYWGEAMTFNHTFSAEQDISGGRRALAKLGPARAARAAKAKTEREREYLNAAEILYGEGDRDQRDSRFADAMRALSLHYPDDVDASVFYALALLGTLRFTDHTYDIQMTAASVLGPLLEKFPNHPGALSSFIHANDDPEHAHLALAAAERYEELAGDNFHALHMPSHIYVQLGMWPEVVRANRTAFEASDRDMRAKGLSVAFRDYHSLDWLIYGELQMGQYRKAREHVMLSLESAQQPNVPRGMGGQAAVFAARFAVETGQWDILAPFPQVHRTAELLFAQGMAAVNRNDPHRARSIIAALDSLSQEDSRSGRRTKTALDDSLKNELAAALALSEKRPADAERLAAESVEYETTIEFPSGPPDLIKPSYEFYGETLLALHKPALAAQQFSIELKRMPNRALSLLGLARARAAEKDEAGATRAYRELARIWANADPEVRSRIADKLR